MRAFGIFFGCAFAMTVGAVAQDSPIDFSAWESVPPDKSGLVFYLNADVKGSAFEVFDKASASPPQSFVWETELPLLKQYRVEPGRYEVRLPGPIDAVSVATSPGKLTFLRIERFESDGGEPGVQIASWTGTPSPEITSLLKALMEQGIEQVLPIALEAPQKVINFSVDPPFEYPPEPKPKK